MTNVTLKLSKKKIYPWFCVSNKGMVLDLLIWSSLTAVISLEICLFFMSSPRCRVKESRETAKVTSTSGCQWREWADVVIAQIPVSFLESWVQEAQNWGPPPHSSSSLVSLTDIPLSPRTQKWERIPKFHQNITLSSTLSGRRYQSSPDRKLWWLEKRRKAKHTEWNLTPGHKLLGTRQHILNFYGNEKKQPATMGGVHKCLKNQWL